MRRLGSTLAVTLAAVIAGCHPGLRPAARAGAAPPGGAPATTTRAEAAPDPATTPAPEPKAAARESAVTPPPAPKRPELPRGGRELFPRYRLVGFCGTPGAPSLGRLRGKLPKQAKKVTAYADKYAKGREPMPVFELIAVVVLGGPGRDKKYRRRVPSKVVDEYLKVARASKGLLLLNIQPGHSDFMTEVKHFEKYLREPDVGVALDPEWAMKPKQKPGVYYGQTTGKVIDEVAAYLSGIVQENDLPEKALVFHQMNSYVVKHEDELTTHPGVAIIKSVDGQGPKGTKKVTYHALIKGMPEAVHPGFKLFFSEDTKNKHALMTPDEVLALSPVPEYVMYE